MPWEPLTKDEVLQEFNTAEKQAYEAVQESPDDASLTAIIGRVVERVRSAILSGGGPLAAAGTLPSGLKGEAIAIARWRFLMALPKDDALQSENRRQAHDSALALLKDVAQGKFKIEVPDAPQQPAPETSITGAWGTNPRIAMRSSTTQ